MDNYAHEDINVFFESYYHSFGQRPYLDDEWFHWFYTMNPAGLCKQYILVDLLKSKWIGGFGFAPNNFVVNDVTYKGVLTVNGFINPGYENQGLYTSMIRSCLDEEKKSGIVIFGFPNRRNIPSQRGFQKNSFTNHGNMSFLEMVPCEKSLEIKEVNTSDRAERFQNLDYQRLLRGSNFNFYRSYEYFRWRFETRPHKKYLYLSLFSKKTMGYMILGFYNSSVGKKHCQIVDFGWDDKNCFVPLLNKAQRMALNESCDILDILVMDDSETEKLCLENNMIKREDGYDMFYYASDGSILPDECHITYADNDVI